MLPGHCGENVPAPVVIISKADAKHVPTTASIGRVVDEIGRPSQPDDRAELIAAAPNVYYVTEHYVEYRPC